MSLLWTMAINREHALLAHPAPMSLWLPCGAGPELKPLN
jgi:hypothetical protein